MTGHRAGRGLRLAARLARREVRRRPGRTALIVALVAVPVCAMTIAVVLLRTVPLTPLDKWERSSGQADATRSVEPSALDDPLPSWLPPGTRAVRLREAAAEPVRAEGGPRSDMTLTDAPLADPMVEGMIELVEGRAPAAGGEVAVSRALADRLGAGVGDVVDLARPAGARWSVVGLVEQWHCLACPVAVVAPGTEWPGSDLRRSARWLLDLPAGLAPAEVAELDRAVVLRDPVVAGDRPTVSSGWVRWALVIGALALTVAGIVIAAAFAVGARRQLVTIGQLSASGAGAGVVRAVLVLQGTFSGLLGTIAGLAAGGTALAVGRSWTEGAVGHRIGPWQVPPADVLAVAGVGVMAATLAALVPARTATRVPTLQALAGRRALPPVRRRLTAAGVAAVAAGLGLLAVAVLGSRSNQNDAVWALVAITGGVTELLGACAVTPLLVSRLERLATWTSGSWRLAARSLARHRTRSGGVLAAVAAAGALAVAGSALALANEVEYDPGPGLADDVVLLSPPVQPLTAAPAPFPERALAAVASATGDREPLTVRAAPDRSAWVLHAAGRRDGRPQVLYGAGSGSTHPVIGDPPVLDAFDVPAAARAALARDGLVVLDDEADPDVVVVSADGTPMPAEVVAVDHLVASSPVVVTPELADRLGLEPAATAVAFFPPGGIGPGQEDALYDLFDELEQTGDGAGPYLAWGDDAAGDEPARLPLELVLAGVAVAFSLFVVGTSLALSAAESKDERDVLTAAGAPPAALARAAGAKAWLLAVLGGLLAVPVGLLPVVVGTVAAATPVEGRLVIPVRTIVLLVVVAPVVVALASALASAAAQRVRPVRVSTAAFE